MRSIKWHASSSFPFIIYFPKGYSGLAKDCYSVRTERERNKIRKRGTKEAGKKGGGGKEGGRRKEGKGGKGSTNDRKCVCGSKGEDQGRGGLDRLHWQRRASNKIKTPGLVAIEAGNTLLVWQ